MPHLYYPLSHTAIDVAVFEVGALVAGGSGSRGYMGRSSEFDDGGWDDTG
jgi:hypothetical protein